MADEDRHPDLERFYEALLAEEDDEFYPDDDEDDEDDDEMYLDPDDMEGEIDDEDGNAAFYLHDLEALAAEEDDDDAMDLQDEDDEGYEDEEDDEDDDGGQQYISLQELLSAAGGTVQARSSILAQLLAGSGGPASGTRSGGFRFRSSPIDPEERARALAERRRRERWWEPQTEPHPRGLQLLRSGEFGSVGPWRQKRARMLVPRRSVRPVAQV
jgi:WD repeat-containing protein 23